MDPAAKQSETEDLRLSKNELEAGDFGVGHRYFGLDQQQVILSAIELPIASECLYELLWSWPVSSRQRPDIGTVAVL